VRRIIGSNFSNCVGATTNRGNDYADVTDDESVFGVYETTSFINIVSTSAPIKFYFQVLGLSFDCFIENTCGKYNTIYISAVNGEDNIFCGLSDDPCASVEYGWSNILNTNGTIYVSNGTYGIRPRLNGLWTVKLEGTGNIIDEVDYPVIYCPTVGTVWFNISNSDGSQQIGFKNLKLLYPSSGFTGYLLSTFSPNSYVNLTNCYVVSNATNSHPSLFQSYYGYMYVINTTFHTHNFTNYGIFYYVAPSSSNCHIFTNCTFRSLISSYYPAVTYLSSVYPYLNFTGCTFVNISTHSSSSSYYGTVIFMYQGNSSYRLFSNNSFVNITGAKSCLGIYAYTNSFTYYGLTFNNVGSSLTGGGAVMIATSTTTYSFTFVGCVFSGCKTTGSSYRGGMMIVLLVFFLFVFFSSQRKELSIQLEHLY
jgi:hypothetical protein